jgi:hypothetical protein
MTMHLEGPWLSTTGKQHGRAKFRSAEQARRARELEADWQQLQAKWAPSKAIKPAAAKSSLPTVHPRLLQTRQQAQSLPSKPDTVLGAVTVRKPQQYTGTKIIGIGTMHKSNQVPVFSDTEARELSTMRRG